MDGQGHRRKLMEIPQGEIHTILGEMKWLPIQPDIIQFSPVERCNIGDKHVHFLATVNPTTPATESEVLMAWVYPQLIGTDIHQLKTTIIGAWTTVVRTNPNIIPRITAVFVNNAIFNHNLPLLMKIAEKYEGEINTNKRSVSQ